MQIFPMIFFPGLNGDARVLRPQTQRFPSLKVVQWAPPNESESIATYARRLALLIDPGCPCLLGGVSFGGIVALEAARHLQAKECILIASSRDAHGLPTHLRIMRLFAKALHPSSLRLATLFGWEGAATLRSVRRRRARWSPQELVFRQWAFRAILTWKPSDPPCPVLQLHGERDLVFSARRTRAQKIIHGAGHLITCTHVEEVNQFLCAAISRCVKST